MKLMVFDELIKVKEGGDDIETVVLVDMSLIFLSFGDEGTVKFIYSAHDADGNIYYFARFFRIDDSDAGDNLILQQLKSLMVSGDNITFENTVLMYFRCTNNDGYATSMLTHEREDKRYIFYAGHTNDDNTNDIMGFIIDRHINVGLNIINRNIIMKSFTDNSLAEANMWMMGFNGRAEATYAEATEFKILDVSRSVKKSKDIHAGIVIFKTSLIEDDGSTNDIVCCTAYIRDTKLRSRAKTMDITLLADKYPMDTIWNFGQCSGCNMNPDNGDNRQYLIAYHQGFNVYKVISVKDDIYNTFRKMISEL